MKRRPSPGKTLSLDDWLCRLLDDPESVFPNNCFPSLEHLSEYLDRCGDFSAQEVLNHLTSFLIQNTTYGNDQKMYEWETQQLERQSGDTMPILH